MAGLAAYVPLSQWGPRSPRANLGTAKLVLFSRLVIRQHLDQPGPCTPTGGGGGRRSRLLCALGLFALLLAVYMGNAYTAGNNDATGNVRLPLQVLEHGRLTFTPEDSPFMFTWRLRLADREGKARFRDWRDVAGGETMRAHLQSGALDDPQPKYYLAPTRQPDAYANTFGLGAGLLALPVLAVVKPLAPPHGENPAVLWQVGKLVAAAAVAGSAVFLFLAALSHLSLWSAFVLALLYGLCTCAWSVSSQILLQHGPAGLFLAMGTCALLKKTPLSTALAGLAFSASVACRPTCILVVAVVAAWLAVRARRDWPALLHFCLGAMPVGLLLVLYGWHAFGDPLQPANCSWDPRWRSPRRETQTCGKPHSTLRPRVCC